MDEQDARIRAVLDQAVHDGASYQLAVHLGELDAAGYWLDAVWNGLRDGLRDDGEHPTLHVEDRLTAIVLLLDERMSAEWRRIVDGVGKCRP
jgi:hypothetical protein